MKLIKTKLLLKHNHNSAVGIATASHIDFCRYQVRCLKPEWKFGEPLITFIYSCLCVLSIPLLLVTNGIILYPFWIIFHIVKVKKIIKEFGVDNINKGAEKLIKEQENENI